MSPDSVSPHLALLLREAELATHKGSQSIFKCISVAASIGTEVPFCDERIDLCFVQQDLEAMEAVAPPLATLSHTLSSG